MLVRAIQTFLVGLGAATIGFILMMSVLTWNLQHSTHSAGLVAVSGGIGMSVPFLLLPFALGITWNLYITRRH
jgi:hypothetical protein